MEEDIMMDIVMDYLVICYIAIENGHRNSGFTYSKW
jgi:hypothetical protein